MGPLLMRTVLAFGDSLTWGTDAARECRHDFKDRWPNVLQAKLGDGYHVIPEGLGGRTTSFDDFAAPADRNGARVLPTLLGSHNPLDLVIIMLGANDLKPHICGSAIGAAAGMARLAEIVRTYPYNWGAAAPQVLLVSPPLFTRKSDGSGPQSGRSIAASTELAKLYAEVAAVAECGFFDASDVAAASSVDGVHLDSENTRAIGEALAPIVRQMLS